MLFTYTLTSMSDLPVNPTPEEQVDAIIANLIAQDPGDDYVIEIRKLIVDILNQDDNHNRT